MSPSSNNQLSRKFETSMVGSFPRPQAVRDLFASSSNLNSIKITPPGEVEEASVDIVKGIKDTPAKPPVAHPLDTAAHLTSEYMDGFISYALLTQQMAGLDVVTDGEWRRQAYTHVINDLCHGFSIDPRPGIRFGLFVTEPISSKNPGLLAKDAKFLVKNSTHLTKMSLPSPYILGARLWDPEYSTKAYPNREDFIDDLVPILNHELKELTLSGVDIVQIDEPDMAVLLDPNKEPIYGDREYDLSLGASKINEMLDGITGVRTAMHMCRWNSLNRGWHWEGGYEPIIDTLKTINVDQFFMEFSIPVAGSVSILKELPEDKLIGLGCLDPRSEIIPDVDQIVDRVEDALQYVSADRIGLNPDCGFAPDIRHNIPLDECYGKLVNQVKAAQILRDKHS